MLISNDINNENGSHISMVVNDILSWSWPCYLRRVFLIIELSYRCNLYFSSFDRFEMIVGPIIIIYESSYKDWKHDYNNSMTIKEHCVFILYLFTKLIYALILFFIFHHLILVCWSTHYNFWGLVLFWMSSQLEKRIVIIWNGRKWNEIDIHIL
jgi:type IV secretory pathway VirB3-like protein